MGQRALSIAVHPILSDFKLQDGRGKSKELDQDGIKKSFLGCQGGHDNLQLMIALRLALPKNKGKKSALDTGIDLALGQTFQVRLGGQRLTHHCLPNEISNAEEPFVGDARLVSDRLKSRLRSV